MTKYTTVIILVGVFLLAMFLHMFLTRKEFFADATTPLDKTNVQKLLDDTVLDLLATYQKLKDSKSTDTRVKVRISAYTDLLNQLNANYLMFKYAIQQFDYKSVSMITLENLQLVRQYLTNTMATVAPADVATPVDLPDLDQYTRRTTGFYNFLNQKLPLVGLKFPAELDSTTMQLLETMRNLKRDLPTMKPADIPLLKTDLYLFVFVFAKNKFVVPTDVDLNKIPDLDTTNLPSAGNPFSKLADTLAGPPPPVPPPVTPTPLPTSAPTGLGTPAPVTPSSSGLKFSELVQSLLSYAPQTQGAQTITILPVEQATASASDLLATPSDASLGSNIGPSFFDKIRGIVHDEVSGQLSNVAMGPKDTQNAKLADRNASPVETKVSSEVNSDALQQGADYRSSSECPYAQGQAPGGAVMPYPIDMNDYIRKDSIPCWGCTLK